MAITKTLSIFEYNIGAEITNAYLRLIPLGFNLTSNMWEFSVKVYLNKESRETERLAEYFLSKFGTGLDINDIVKPETVSDENWEKIKLYWRLGTVGGSRSIATYERGISSKVFTISDITDKNAIIAEAYVHLKRDFPVATDVLDDLSVSQLLEKYLPGYTE